MSDFVTVAQAAAKLGVSVRTAQRHAAKLADSDRETPVSGQWRVNLSALAQRLGKAEKLTSENDATLPPVDATRRDNDAATIGEAVSPGEVAELRARIVDKERENIRLWDALQRAQENEQKALTELSETRRENMIILGSIANKQIPERVASVSPNDATNGVSVASPDAATQSVDLMQSTATEGSDPVQNHSESVAKVVPISKNERQPWQFWRWLERE